MNALLACILLYLPVSLGYTLLLAKREDRRYLLQAAAFAWLLLGSAVVTVDMWLPFSEGGDDLRYFNVVESPGDAREDIFDLGRFASVLEQPGYPWLLSLFSVLAGEQLLAYKFSNLMFFIMLAVTWYRIALVLDTPAFARRVMVAMLCLAPLHYYVFFLLKDMVIAFIQSVFLLGLLLQWRNHPLPSIGLVVSAMFSLILFRIPLLLQDGLVAVGSAVSYSWKLNRVGWQLMTRSLGLVVVGALIYMATNSETLYQLGIRSERRILGSEAMWQQLMLSLGASRQADVTFPVVWLLSEVAIFNPDGWRNLDSTWLRGMLALPWIFLFVPMFLIGMGWVCRRPEGSSGRGLATWLKETRLLHSPWSVLMVFLASSFAISGVMQDTVRYRLPDMPVMAAIATAGWLYASPRLRRSTLFLSLFGFGLVITTYYLLRSL